MTNILDTIKEQEKEFDEKVSYPSDNRLHSISDEEKMVKDTDKHFYYPSAYPESIWEIDEQKIKLWHKSSSKALLEAVIEMVEGMKKDYFVHYFNEENRAIRQALSDLQTKLKEQLKSLTK